MELTGQDSIFMQAAIDLAAKHMRAKDGGPFGAVITRDGEIIARGWNKVTTSNDPTAHAEMTAIRGAAAALGTFQLRGCVLYTSCEPCPMCLGATYWARLDRLVFAANRQDAAQAGFDDQHIYNELSKPVFTRDLPTQNILREQALEIFTEWRNMPDKVPY